MSNRHVRYVVWFSVAILLLALALLVAQLPLLGAGGLLHPVRTRTTQSPPAGCEDQEFAGTGVTLRGWRCHADGEPRGTIVYLHGIADNRASGAGVALRFQPRGFDVVAYDSRAHGDSGGDACTYGFFEKQDLRAVLHTVRPGPIVLMGTSLGAAVALQAAAEDRRVSAVVAAEVFSDLETVAHERAPFFFTDGVIRRALRVASDLGRFDVAAASPTRAAAAIRVPVLLVHGAADVDTVPEHSRRVFDALKGPRRLILVPGATHNRSLTSDVRRTIEQWVDSVVPPN